MKPQSNLFTLVPSVTLRLAMGLAALGIPASLHAASARPNLAPYKPSGWDGSITVLDDDGSAKVGFAVANLTKVDVTASFRVQLLLDGESVQRWKYNSLKGFYYARVTGFNLGRLTTGWHTLELRVDSSAEIRESVESDNTATLRFEVQDDDVLTWPLPASKTTISQHYGVTWSQNSAKNHTGIDITAPKGTKVYAVKGGEVTKVGSLGMSSTGEDWGNYIIVGHEGDQWTSCYLHVKHSMRVGDRVEEGDVIGTVFKDHLHFGIRKAGTSSMSPRGALPKKSSSGSDPAFPEKFVDPESLTFES